jgi:hypothetical protein
MKNHSPYKTIVSLVFGLILLFILKGFYVVPYVVLGILILSLLSSKFVNFVDRTLNRLLLLIGKLLSTIILGLFFYLILFPIKLISKIFNKKDNLQLMKPIKSNFKNTNKSFSMESFENLW